jgi:hypothetical protein
MMLKGILGIQATLSPTDSSDPQFYYYAMSWPSTAYFKPYSSSTAAIKATETAAKKAPYSVAKSK